MERARPVIFYRADCAKSQKALEYLEARNVRLDRVEITDHPESSRHLEHATGQTKTPALIHGREQLHDFDIPRLASFLEKYQLDTKRRVA